MKHLDTLSQARWVRWLHRPRSLQWKIMALVGLTYLATLVLILILVVTSIRRTEASAWLSRQTEAAHSAGDTVAGFLQRTEDTLNFMSLLGRDELAVQPEVIRQVLQYNPALLEIVALDANGQVFASASQDRAVLANLFTIPQSQWFATAKAGRPYFGGVRISAGDEPYLIVALPAFDGGVVATRLKMDVLWNVVGNIRFGKAGHAYVVDQTGNVIAHTDPGIVLAETTIAGRPEILNTLSAADRQWSGEYRNLGGADVVGVTGPIGRTEWTIVTELPQAEAYQYSRSAIVMIGGGMLAISIIMMGLLRRNLRRLVFQPMTQLQTGAERIGQGDLSYRVRLIRQDEIGRVAQAFDDMAEHLQQRDRQVVEQNAALAAEVLERQRAEETLHASETQLRRITDNMRDVISEIDAQGNILYASTSHLWVLGCRPEEVLGQPIYERLHPDDAPAMLLGLAGALETNTTPEAVTFRYRHTDGHYVWMECTATLLYDETGEPSGAILSSRDVTQRKSAEEALRVSEARLRLALHASRMLAWDFDPQTRTLLLSDNAVEIWGSPISGLEDTLNVLHPDDKPGMLSLWTSALAQGGEHLTQFRIVQPNTGAIRWMEARGRVQQDAAGAIRLGGVIFDISERKQAEEEIRRLNADLELRVLERTGQLTQANISLLEEIEVRRLAEELLQESEERYRRHFENAFDVIYALDLEFKVASISPSVERVLGYRPDEIMGRNMLDVQVLAPECVEQAVQDTLRVCSGEHITAEYEFIARDGRRVLGEVSGAPLFEAAGQVVGVISVARDITDRKQAERRSSAFASLAQRLNATSSPKEAAHIIVDVARHLLGWDACFIDLYSPETDLILYNVLMMDTVNGQSVELPIPDTNYTPTPVVRRAIDEGGQLLLLHDWDTEHGELVSFGEGEQQAISLMFVPIRHGAQVIGVLSIQSYASDAYDQSDLDTLQSLADHCGAALERIKVEDQVRASLCEKEVLLKEIHHRVKNNLQVISSLLSLQSSHVQDLATLEILRESQHRVRSMALIHEKLYQSDDLARVDFAEYVRNLATYLFRSYKVSPAAISLSIETAPDLRLSLDAAIPCGLIINELVSNALKHAFPDDRAGEICIAFGHAADGQYRLRVSDSGVGFPAGLDFRQSTSLGLQLVNTLIEQLDGTIELQRNGGTEFVARFGDVKR